MEDNLKKMEDDLKSKIHQIGCDTIVNSPSSSCLVTAFIKTPEGVVVGFPNFAWALK
jgi:hypothetical protein